MVAYSSVFWSVDSYVESRDMQRTREAEIRDETRHPDFDKGQSKRIWGELYKVWGSHVRSYGRGWVVASWLSAAGASFYRY